MCHASVSHKSAKQECPRKSAKQDFFYKSVLHEYSKKVSDKSVQQECLTRAFQSIERECQASVSSKSVPKDCPERVFYKSVVEECRARVSGKSVSQECQARESSKSVPQECPQRSVKQECSARVVFYAIQHLLFVFLCSSVRTLLLREFLKNASGIVVSISFFLKSFNDFWDAHPSQKSVPCRWQCPLICCGCFLWICWGVRSD